MTETGNDACPVGGSERQVNGFLLPDSISTQREQRIDRMGLSVVGPVQCRADASMTAPVCTMKTLGHELTLASTYDRHAGKCQARKADPPPQK